ncbi:MAG: fructosamine kinase family protein [Treponema sp.]|nr:fructosamine kinase family protein [Treponema sp.]
MEFEQPPHFNSLATAVSTLFGNTVTVIRRDRVSGGDINMAYALTLSDGKRIFMKANGRGRVAFFTSEAASLAAIASTGAIGTPQVLCTGFNDGYGSGQGAYSFLLLEFIQSGGRKGDYWETFARELAAMHQADTKAFTSENFGFFQNNFIGSTAQDNTPCGEWVTFFRDHRLSPQLRAASPYLSQGDRRRADRLLDHLDSFLVEPEAPSLLHGDLWSGNVFCGSDGKALLIDPASYVGHAEADIAMTQLFGSFPPAFYSAYREVFPMQAGYEDRRDLYNLYQLLNHLNLFGGSYLGAVRAVLARYAG